MTDKSKTQAIRLDRRTLIATGLAAGAAAAALPKRVRAQARIAPPNIIKAGTLVMSINPTLPPLQFVDDRGQLQEDVDRARDQQRLSRTRRPCGRPIDPHR